jgi:hypothetical protein
VDFYILQRELIMGGIKLTTPKNTGDLDSTPYTDIRISRVVWNLVGDRIAVTYQLGSFNEETGEFKSGILESGTVHLEDSSSEEEQRLDYTDIFEETAKEGNLTIAERLLELISTKVSEKLELPGTPVKPGRRGKKKLPA